MAILQDGIDSFNSILNDSVIFTAKKGQLMLYYNYAHHAFIADGRFGYIPPKKIKRIDTSYFKFNYSSENFVFSEDYELTQVAHKIGFNLNKIVKRIIKKDPKALKQFLKLQKAVDGIAAEEFPSDFWSLINLWTDKEISTFINSLDTSVKKDFCWLLITSSMCDPIKYYRQYYPMTFDLINSTIKYPK